MSLLFILDIFLKVVFFGSIAGLLFFVLKKTSMVKALVIQENIQHNLDILKLPQKIKDAGQGIGKEMPKRAIDMANKNKDKLAKKLLAVKTFSQKTIIYKFKKLSPKFPFKKHNAEELEIEKKDAADKEKKFDSSYWDNIQNQ